MIHNRIPETQGGLGPAAFVTESFVVVVGSLVSGGGGIVVLIYHQVKCIILPIFLGAELL